MIDTWKHTCAQKYLWFIDSHLHPSYTLGLSLVSHPMSSSPGRHVGGFFGHLSASHSHCHSNVCLLQGGGVIDPITCHGHNLILILNSHWSNRFETSESQTFLNQSLPLDFIYIYIDVLNLAACTATCWWVAWTCYPDCFTDRPSASWQLSAYALAPCERKQHPPDHGLPSSASRCQLLGYYSATTLPSNLDM